MKFTGHEDVAAPIEFVFEQMTDFPALERFALRRGAEVQRLDDLPDGTPGMQWDAAFTMRGKRRDLMLELTQFEPPNRVCVSSRSPSMGGDMIVDLVALSRLRTRISIEIDMKPKTLSARLLVQSMKLARANLTRRFTQRVASYAEDIEERYKAHA